jgi:hypothetical protein
LTHLIKAEKESIKESPCMPVPSIACLPNSKYQIHHALMQCEANEMITQAPFEFPERLPMPPQVLTPKD